LHCGISIRGLLPDIGKNSSHIVGLLERGIAVRQGQRFLRMELPRILATPPDVLPPAWCVSSRNWPLTGAGLMSASRGCPARSRSLPNETQDANA